jgi:hypothetical protein
MASIVINTNTEVDPSQCSNTETVNASPGARPTEPLNEVDSRRSSELRSVTLPEPAFREVRFDPGLDSVRNQSEEYGPNLEIWQQRRYRKWKYPFLMSVFYAIGLAFSVAHCAFYAALDNDIVGSPEQQQRNLSFGTAFAFLSQIAFSASVWQTYDQWIWRSIKKIALRMATINDIFRADTSVMSFLNIDMLKSFKVGYVVALLGW